MPRHYRHHNHHELFLRWLHMSCTTTFGHRRHHLAVAAQGAEGAASYHCIFHFFSDAAEGKIVVMQSSLGCWSPSSWRATWSPSSPCCGLPRCCVSFKSSFFSITFQRRSQLVIGSSKGCFPLYLPLVSFMVSAPFNLLHVENNKVAAIPSTWLAQPFEDLPPEHLLLQSGQ